MDERGGIVMPLESQGERAWSGRSPGGFEFGIQGWTWGEPKPTTITFFLDNTAMVCDQYGRHIRRAVDYTGAEVHFADTAPEASREGGVSARPQFATHVQVLEALRGENINWLAYEVRHIDRAGGMKSRGGLTLADAVKWQEKLLADGSRAVYLAREITCAGWPQLLYDQLKLLPELPPTPIDELRKILNPQLRRDALRIKREVESVREREEQKALAE